MSNFKLIIAFLFIPLLGFCYEYQLCITAMFQNEAPYLVEWIEYHRERGVEFFRLYNHHSTDNFHEVLDPYTKNGIVEIVDWTAPLKENDGPNFVYRTQADVYNDSINYFKGKTKWLAIIDTDEFIFPVVEDKILDVLEKYFPTVSGLNINWQNFGTSGIAQAEKIGENVFLLGSLIRKAHVQYTHNGYCKSIVQPDHVSHCVNAHYCEFIKGHWGVNTRFQPTKGRSMPVDISKIRINHYWGRDEWFFNNVKLPRYKRWGHPDDYAKRMISEMNDVEDRDIQRFLPLKFQIEERDR